MSEPVYIQTFPRMQQADAIISNKESIIYEWLRTADHPKFREVLSLVKENSK